MSVENFYLHQFGFNPEEYERLNKLPIAKRKEEVQRNLESNKLEAYLDAPVSPLFRYWFSEDGNLYSDSSLIPETHVSKQITLSERDGLVKYGFTLVEKKILENPGSVVLWYSPPGKKSLLHDVPDEKPYDYGQLYIYSFDGGSVKAAAVKIGGEGILPILSPDFAKLLSIQDEAERISTTLLYPVVLHEDLSSFLTRNKQKTAVYKDHKGRIYYWSDIIKDLQDTFAGKRNNVFRFDKQLAVLEKETLTEEDLVWIHLSALKDHLLHLGYAYHQEMEFHGGCPGKSASMSMIDSILGGSTFKIPDMFDIHNSLMREARQMEWSYHNGKCRVCGREHTEVGPCSVCKECERKLINCCY